MAAAFTPWCWRNGRKIKGGMTVSSNLLFHSQRSTATWSIQNNTKRIWSIKLIVISIGKWNGQIYLFKWYWGVTIKEKKNDLFPGWAQLGQYAPYKFFHGSTIWICKMIYIQLICTCEKNMYCASIVNYIQWLWDAMVFHSNISGVTN